MDIEKFLIQYKATPDDKKVEFMKKHITTKYLPYENKVSLCKEILDRSMWIEVNDKQVFNLNSPVQYMLLIQALIRTYTDIDVPDDGKGSLEVFNIFEEYGITAYMIQALESEYSSLSTILKMQTDDLIFNNTNLVAFIDQKFEALNLSLDALMIGLGEVIANQQENIEQFPENNVG